MFWVTWESVALWPLVTSWPIDLITLILIPRPIKYWYSFTISCRCISWLDPKPILWGSIHSGIWDKHHVVPRSHSDSVWLASSHSKVLMLRQYNSHIITLVSKRIYFILFEMPLTSTSICDCIMRYTVGCIPPGASFCSHLVHHWQVLNGSYSGPRARQLCVCCCRTYTGHLQQCSLHSSLICLMSSSCVRKRWFCCFWWIVFVIGELEEPRNLINQVTDHDSRSLGFRLHTGWKSPTSKLDLHSYNSSWYRCIFSL